MPASHLRIETEEKKLILVVEDEPINREILGQMLSDDYNVIYAENGREALEQIERIEQQISLILLDLLMPVMTGMTVLERLKESPNWSKIPVIVMTSDQQSEAACLDLGAMDFISKPYPTKEVTLARIRRIIELFEDREIIHSTERDPLTNLYNREFFYNYATGLDQRYKKESMDAIVVDITSFHLIVDRYGRVQANQILKQVGRNLRDMMQETGGIVGRREEDIFMIYCPHRTDYSRMLDCAVKGIGDETGSAGKIRLRMGVYQDVDRSVGMEQRFDRAKTAADLLRGNYTQNIAFYDTKLYESELFAEKLAEDFEQAIREKQFTVYYQPKYDVRGDEPLLYSAEALVRWEHPELGMISPGVFVPLFEENGMVRRLDTYVWEEAARQVREWKDRNGTSIPVSVNVSRVDLFDSGIVPFFGQLLRDYGLEPDDMSLEITESAYTEDEDYIIATVCELRAIGLKVEMDDFGSGYSSLGMISRLPIDALKLDMAFVRNAFSGSGDVRMIELVLDISDYLGVPVIAEGVETKEQTEVLKKMGCDIIQGSYFSQPVPADDFAVFIEKKIQMLADRPPEDPDQAPQTSLLYEQADSLTFARIAQALAADYFSIYYVDIQTDRFFEFTAHEAYDDLGIEKEGEDFFNLSRRNILRVMYPEDQRRFLQAFTKENVLEKISENGAFTITYRLLFDGVPNYVSLKATSMGGGDASHIVVGVNNIHSEVQRKMETVTYASISEALAADYFSIYYVNMETEEFIEYSSHEEYESLNIEKGGENFFETSRNNVLRVMYPDDLEEFLEVFTKENLARELDKSGAFTISYRLVFDGEPSWVSMKATRMMDPRDPHIVIGVNNIDHQMRREREFERSLESARSAVRKDVLTGVKSKFAFTEAEQEIDSFIRDGKQAPFAVAVCDVNGLKEINDTKGHKVGDQYIKDACAVICEQFKRSPVFRIGGDEFVAILQGADYRNRDTLVKRFGRQNEKHLQSGEVVIACGISEWSGDRKETIEQVFERADEAMYENKKRLKET